MSRGNRRIEACLVRGRLEALARLAVLIASLPILVACFPKPLDLQLRDARTGEPVADVALHKHAVSLLTLLPSRQDPVRSDATGAARVWVPPLNTNITMLRPGYEPASIAVFKRQVPASMRSSEQTRLVFDEIREGDVVPMPLQPVTRSTMRVQVSDADSGAPLADAEVLAGTFLYLPAPGVEQGWGFPDLQRLRTDTAGTTDVECVSGFRNRVTARMPGRAEVFVDIREDPPESISLRSRPLRWKPVRFEVLDEKRGTPVADAWVTMDEPRRGLPPDPNGFAARTGPDGLTPPILVPDVVPLVIHIRADGHRDRREALAWTALRGDDIRTVWIRRKGWFE
jgi:hypothetical protein